MAVRGVIRSAGALLVGAALLVAVVVAVGGAAAGPARGAAGGAPGASARHDGNGGAAQLVGLAGGDTVTVDLWRRAGGDDPQVLHVTGGRVVAGTLRGRIDCLEALQVGDRTAHHVAIDTRTGTVTGTVGGRREVVLRFDARTFSWKPPDGGVFETWDVPLTLGGRPAGDLGMRVSAA